MAKFWRLERTLRYTALGFLFLEPTTSLRAYGHRSKQIAGVLRKRTKFKDLLQGDGPFAPEIVIAQQQSLCTAFQSTSIR